MTNFWHLTKIKVVTFLISRLLLEIKAQTEIILENMKMWENEHEEREKIIQKKISKQSEHIK